MTTYLKKKRFNAYEPKSLITKLKSSDLPKDFALSIPLESAEKIINDGFNSIQNQKKQLSNKPTRNDEKALLKKLHAQTKAASLTYKKLLKQIPTLKETITTLDAYGMHTKQALLISAEELAKKNQANLNASVSKTFSNLNSKIPEEMPHTEKPYPALEGIGFILNELCNQAKVVQATHHLDHLSLIAEGAITHLSSNKGHQGKQLLQFILKTIAKIYHNITKKDPLDNFTYSGGETKKPCQGEFYRFIEYILPIILSEIGEKISVLETPRAFGKFIKTTLTSKAI